ncbi:hypothetical protein PhCBS80983_g02460 [Powellomyces hirtus]|uniref:L-type lectin-like domain-containing protein n=1 Tax=Powellomyces hirtus TaxID=109895 RepID=A0A507E824_9FUNG|nr:hypothetical protein PhCBS80983_g02460 [Powellomyces hirtus]
MVNLPASWLLLLTAFASNVFAAKHSPESEQTFTLFSYSIQPPYIEENLQNRWWEFGGDAYMEVNNYIRLTADKRSKQGYLWTKHPFTTNSWLVEFEFKVHGSSTGLHGDGFAFWYTSQKNSRGPVFGSQDKFTGLGVFFDTYANGRHRYTFPRINANMGDGKTNYDHDNDGAKGELGACEADFRNSEFPTKARVRYIRETKTLQVFTNFNGGIKDADWNLCFEKTDLDMPKSGYLGFSAHTGEVSDFHDIINVKTQGISFSYKDGQTPPSDAKSSSGSINNKKDASPPAVNKQYSYNTSPQKNSESSGAGLARALKFMLKMLLALIAIAAICYGVWKYAQRQEERSFKRF